MLRATIGRGGVRDPIVNGYTRRVRGQLALIPFGPAQNAGPGLNAVATQPVASFAGVLQAVTIQAGDDPSRSLAGIELGSVLMYHGQRGANGGPELWVAGVYTGASAQVVGFTLGMKLAVDGTTVRAWYNGAALANAIYAGAARGTAYLYLQTNGNPGDNSARANYRDIVAARDNALHFARCPAGGFAVVTLNAGAPVTVNLDGAGTGALDLGNLLFPFALTLDIQDATHTSQAQLIVPKAFGGDEYGLLR